MIRSRFVLMLLRIKIYYRWVLLTFLLFLLVYWYCLWNFPLANDGYSSLTKVAKREESMKCSNDLRKASVDISSLRLYESLRMPGRGGGDKDWDKVDMNYSDSRRRDDPLRIVLVPFSHTDPGWHKTAAEHFFEDSFHVITNAVVKLHQYKKLTFIWAESIYLSWWWDIANTTMRDMMKTLIKEGRFEIVGGGWVMPDEANPTVYSLIDQMLEGHLFLRQKLGFAPKTSFNIDPFGHSATAARIRSLAGLKRSFINRIHYKIKEFLDKNADAEFVWRQEWDVEGIDDLRVSLNPLYTYTIKHSCGPYYWICVEYDFWRPNSAPTIGPVNIHDQAIKLLDQLRKKSLWFKHNVVLVIFGDDFRFIQSSQFDRQFENWNKIFNYINARSEEMGATAKFGTLSEYFQMADEDLGEVSQLKIFGGDFFTYSDFDDDYWSGYFTSRMAWKVLGRRLESLLRAADVFFTLAAGARDGPPSRRDKKVREFQDLRSAHQELALFQHHDDVTGTSKEHNAADIARRLCEGFVKAQRALVGAVWSLMESRTFREGGNVDEPLRVTLLANQKSVGVEPVIVDIRGLAPSITVIILANALPFARREIIRLRINRFDVEVRTTAKILRHQIDPVWSNLGKPQAGLYELVFEAEMEPFEIKRLYIHSIITSSSRENVSKFHLAALTVLNDVGHEKLTNKSTEFPISLNRWPVRSRITLTNGCLAAEFDWPRGLLRRMIVATSEGRSNLVAQIGFLWYPSVRGGAYLFQPSGLANKSSSPLMAVIIAGPLVTTVRVVFPMIEHFVEMVGGRRVDGELSSLSPQSCEDSVLRRSLRITNRVLLKGDSTNLEPVMRIDTDIDSGSHFFTDANGLAMMRRRRLAKLPIQANFYPMSSAAFIEDQISARGRRRLTLLSAQPQGASSQHNGSLEVMQDRRLHNDDSRGMGEGVEDNVLSTLRYDLSLEERGRDETKAPAIPLLSVGAHQLRRRLNSPVEVFFTAKRAADTKTPAALTVKRATPFPCDVDLVSLRPLPNLGPRLEDAAMVLPSNEAVFTLSRPTFDCRYPSIGEVSTYCSATSGAALYLGRHLGEGVGVRNARAASLTLLHDGAALGDDPVIELKPEALISVVGEVERRRDGT